MTPGTRFFDDPMPASLAKIQILRKYLTPFCYKLGSRNDRLWVIYLPPGVTSDYDTSSGFIGHHQHFVWNGRQGWYAVIESMRLSRM